MPERLNRQRFRLRAIWRVGGGLLVCALTAWACLYVYERRVPLMSLLSAGNKSLFALHFLCLIAYFSFTYVVWRSVVIASGGNVSLRGVLVSAYIPSLGKYLPGKVWAVAGRVLLLQQLTDTSRSRAILATLLQYAYEILGATAFLVVFAFLTQGGNLHFLSLFAGAVWIVALFPQKPLGMIWSSFAGVVKKCSLPSSPPNLDARILILFSCHWGLYAMSGAMLVYSFADLRTSEFIAVGCGFVVAWLAGFLSLLTPGGVGVREGVLVTLLAPLIGLDSSVLVAICSRCSWTLVEAASASIALLALSSGRESAVTGKEPVSDS